MYQNMENEVKYLYEPHKKRKYYFLNCFKNLKITLAYAKYNMGRIASSLYPEFGWRAFLV